MSTLHLSHANRDPRQEPPARNFDDKPHMNSKPRNKFVAKGHDVILQRAEYDHDIKLRVSFIDDEQTLTGVVLKRDRWTITLRHEGGDEVLFKHAIRGMLLINAKAV